MLESFEQKALDYYGEVIINKHLIHEAGFGARAIPTYVGEWILSHFAEEGQLTEDSRERIAAFLGKYLPTKGQKDEIKNHLIKLETVQLLDDFSVTVNLKTGKRHLRIPLLDINDAFVSEHIVDQNELPCPSTNGGRCGATAGPAPHGCCHAWCPQAGSFAQIVLVRGWAMRGLGLARKLVAWRCSSPPATNRGR